MPDFRERGMLIRSERASDVAAIAEVHRAAFGQEAEAGLVERIRAADGFDSRLSLVAEIDGRVVGHILFSPIWIETDDGRCVDAMALAPMGVRPECQCRGIGSALVLEGLEVCRWLGHAIVIVVGHAGYYPRFGFERASGLGIRPPFEVPDESFMVMGLQAGVLDRARGVVRYSAAFAAL